MPKLTLRDLFAVVTIAAVLVAWWVDRTRLAKEIELLKSQPIIWRHRWVPAGPKNPRPGFTLDVF